jgi:hypothetical protein
MTSHMEKQVNNRNLLENGCRNAKNVKGPLTGSRGPLFRMELFPPLGGAPISLSTGNTTENVENLPI